MHMRHLLLGRLLQFDRKVIQNGFKNKYLFIKDEKYITCVLLSPKQVYKDQLKLKTNSEVDGSANGFFGQYP